MENPNNETEQQQQKDHKITKINRQADVLDQTRLRPHVVHRKGHSAEVPIFLFCVSALTLATRHNPCLRTSSSSPMLLSIASEWKVIQGLGFSIVHMHIVLLSLIFA